MIRRRETIAGSEHSDRFGCRRWVVSIALALSISAGSNSAWAFRSGRDLPDLSGSDRVAFAGGAISLGLYQALPKGLRLAAVEVAIAEATGAWSVPECSAIQFTYTGTTSDHAVPGDGTNTIEWISDWAERGFPSDAPGATDVQYEKNGDSWVIVEADVYLNRAFTWTTDPTAPDTVRNVATVLTHEVGHALGLLHPCEPGGINGAPACGEPFADQYSGTTMYPFYGETQSTLSQDDKDGVCFLYPKGECPDAGCAENEVCTPEGCVAECQGQVCGVGQVCTAGGCATQGSCEFRSCVGMACVNDFGCGSFDRCIAGTCQHGERPNGDPCETATDCDEGGCLAGVCSRRCSTDSACEGRATCDPLAHACAYQQLALGQSCTDAAECLGDVCLAGAQNAPVCSRECGDSLPSCPNGWACDLVDGKRVCAPGLFVKGCSLSVLGTSPDGSFKFGGLTVLLASIAMARHRARRKYWFWSEHA